MDLHLRLMAETAEEALRGVRASEEFSTRRLAEPPRARLSPTPAAASPGGLARVVRRLLRRG